MEELNARQNAAPESPKVEEEPAEEPEPEVLDTNKK